MMTEEDMLFFERVTRSLRGDLPPDEQEELNRMIESDPAKRKESEKLIVTYDLLSLCAAAEAPSREIPVEVFERIRPAVKKHIKFQKPNRGIWLMMALWISGIVAAIVVGIALFTIWHKPDDKALIEYAVRLRTGSLYGPGAYIAEKMNKIIFPTVMFQGATVEEALKYLSLKSIELDTFTDVAGTKGVPIILRQGDAPSNASLAMDLKDVPMSEALRFIVELTQMEYKVEAYGVLVLPPSKDPSEQFTRSFRVPLDVLSSYDGSAQHVLEGIGMSFPHGSDVNFNPATSILVVRNTAPNLDLVDAFIQLIDYPLNSLVLRDVLDGNVVHEIENESALEEWENNWLASDIRPVFKILIQERDNWAQSWSKFNKYDIGRVKVTGRWHGDDFQKTFTVTSADTWSKVIKEAQVFIEDAVQQHDK